MAELIDKDMLVEALAISRHHHASSNRENELLYRAENIVREQPTVTEAEIRAKAIDDMESAWDNRVKDLIKWCKDKRLSGLEQADLIFGEIAEEMKGAEKDEEN